MTKDEAMALNNEDELAERFGESSVKDIPEAKFPDVAALLPEMSAELRTQIFQLIPGFLPFSLDAINLTEETIKTTIASNEKDQEELSASFRELQAIVRGRLARDGLSEQHERFLLSYLMDLQKMRADATTENKQFLASEANATRRAKLLQASLPTLELVIMAGVRIMITRGRI